MVKVPAVTGVPNPAVPMVAFEAPSGARILPALPAPLIWAVVASCENLNVKLPKVAPEPALAVATEESVVCAVALW